jgi:biopolymer transport protein ExbB
MVDKLLNLALIGGEPIMYVMVFLSLLSIAVVVERYVTYFRNRIDLAEYSAEMISLLAEGKVDEALEKSESINSAESAVTAEGLRNFKKGEKVASKLMDSMSMRRRQMLDRRLAVLGTIGSNAPFVGLLGTVLGIIKAFNDLAFNAGGGPSVVMAGIAEALVATAVGLLVAIPALAFFNYFKNRQNNIMSNVAQLQKIVLAFIDETDMGRDETPLKKAA